MTKKRHFSFDNLSFNLSVAHSGEGKILTTQIMTQDIDTACHFVDMTIIPPHCSIGMHTHSLSNEEFYIVISGTGEMQVGQEFFPVSSGHVIANPRGGTHGLRNSGEEDLKLVVIEIPSQCGDSGR